MQNLIQNFTPNQTLPFEQEGGYIATRNQNQFFDIKLKLQEIIENIISPKELTFDEQMNSKFLELDFGSIFDINAEKIGVNDAIFFINLLNQNELINYSVEGDNLKISDSSNKEFQVTSALLEMLKTSLDTKKPIRLDFDKDVTVILKLDKEGKIQAHFIPGTSEAESYLKQNLVCLKQRFDDEEINYSYLGYSKNQQNSKKQKRSKHER